MLSTLELEPTTQGTIVHFRFAAPKTARERAILQELAPMFEGLFRESNANLVAQLDEEMAKRIEGQRGGAAAAGPQARRAIL